MTTKIQGMGAILHERGVAFRVWAPHARSVAVVGDFGEAPMAAEDEGCWYADVAGAKVGQAYKFRLITEGGEELLRNDPYAREMTHSAGTGLIYDGRDFDWGDDRHLVPPLNQLVIYELHIGTFHDGTFESAIARLDHLVKLGINAIEVMPSAEFAGEISWGYNPAHIFAVESTYGGPRGLKKFVKAAHQRGLAVIMDVVYNHFGPSDLDLWRFDGWHENEGGGIYFYNDWRAETPWGHTRPDFSRPQVRRFLRDNALMWLEEYRVDGLRYDMTAYIRRVRLDDNPECDLPEGWSLVCELNQEIRERFPGKVLIAEDLQDHARLTLPLQEGGAGYHAQWDSRFVHPVRNALITPLDEERSIGSLARSLTSTFNSDPFQSVLYTESHDEVANGKQRVPSEIKPDEPDAWVARKRSVLGAVLTFTAPGVPMIFQGQEFLASGWFQDTEPLDWHLRDDYRGVLRLYRDLIRLRRREAGLQGSGLELLCTDDEAKVLAYHRFGKAVHDRTVVAINLSYHVRENHRLPFPAGGEWQLRLNTDWEDYGFASRSRQSVRAVERDWGGSRYSAQLTLPPYSALIFSQDPQSRGDHKS